MSVFAVLTGHRRCSADAEVPYHNFHHAVDVTVSSYLILTACDARAHMKPIDAFTLMMAAIGHDAGHPGLTNGTCSALRVPLSVGVLCSSKQQLYPARNRLSRLTISGFGPTGYHVHAQSELFKEFGEQSPLEKMHASKTLRICSESDTNLLAGLSEEDRTWVHEVAEFAILGTDMASHFAIMEDWNSRCGREGGLTDSEEDRKALLRMLLKAADLGICGKPWESHKSARPPVLAACVLLPESRACLHLHVESQ